MRDGKVLKQLGGFANPPDVGGHNFILCFIVSVELTNDELRVKKHLDVIGPCSVTELYSRNEGFIFRLVVRCLEHELEGMLVTRSRWAFHNETGPTTLLGGGAVDIQVPRARLGVLPHRCLTFGEEVSQRLCFDGSPGLEGQIVARELHSPFQEAT